MYLISIYFDEKTNKRIQGYINQIATKSGNLFMVDGKVPPHITISAFETRDEDNAVKALEKATKDLKKGLLQWVSVGVFLPGVIYIAPVLNEYLHSMSEKVYESLSYLEDISISKYYRPYQWMPHTTVGKQLTKEEMAKAFETLNNQFGVFEGTVTHIGMAKTNPYRDIVLYEL